MRRGSGIKMGICKRIIALLIISLLTVPGILTGTESQNDNSGIFPGTEIAYAADSAGALLKYAQSQVGQNRQKYLTYVGQWKGSDVHVAWCASFVTYCAHYGGVSDYTSEKTNWCPNIMAYYYRVGEFHNQNSGYTPKPGDIVFFDWNGCCHDYSSACKKGHREHVGIVESVSGGYINTIEGNAGKSNYVKRCSRSSSAYVIGYASPVRASAPSGYSIKWDTVFSSNLGTSIYDSMKIKVTVTPKESDYTGIVLYIVDPDGKTKTQDMGKNTSIDLVFGSGCKLGTYKMYASVKNSSGTFNGSVSNGCVSLNLMRYD